MTDTRKEHEEACEICHGERQVKVGWHPVNNIKIKVEYDPCPNCTPEPHSLHAKQTANQTRAIHARDRATPTAQLSAALQVPEVAALVVAATPFAQAVIRNGVPTAGSIGRTDVTNIRAALAALKGPQT